MSYFFSFQFSNLLSYFLTRFLFLFHCTPPHEISSIFAKKKGSMQKILLFSQISILLAANSLREAQTASRITFLRPRQQVSRPGLNSNREGIHNCKFILFSVVFLKGICYPISITSGRHFSLPEMIYAARRLVSVVSYAQASYAHLCSPFPFLYGGISIRQFPMIREKAKNEITESPAVKCQPLNE